MSCNEIRDTLDAIHTAIKRVQRTLDTRLREPALRAPDGIETQQHGGGWWYLTWKPVAGAGGYQQDHPDTGLGPTPGRRTSIFAVATGDTRVIKVRSAGGDTVSAWAKCTVWWDGRLKVEIEGGGEPPPPEPPAVPTVTRVTAGHESIAGWWTSPDSPAQWEARLVDQAGEHVAGLNTFDPAIVFNRLALDTWYGFEVRAVDAAGLRSEWSETRWIKTLADGETPKPAPPTGLFIHCKADISAKAEWDQHPDIDAWEVWLDDDREQGAITTITPLVKLTKLQPDTTYTVHVVAVVGQPGEPGYAESDPASRTFTTKATVLPPDENPPGNIGADLPAPNDLMVRASSATEVEVSWRDDRPDSGERNFYVVTADGTNWKRVNGSHTTLTDLPAAPETTVSVYGVIGKKLTGITRKATTMQEAGAAR